MFPGHNRGVFPTFLPQAYDDPVARVVAAGSAGPPAPAASSCVAASPDSVAPSAPPRVAVPPPAPGPRRAGPGPRSRPAPSVGRARAPRSSSVTTSSRSVTRSTWTVPAPPGSWCTRPRSPAAWRPTPGPGPAPPPPPPPARRGRRPARHSSAGRASGRAAARSPSRAGRARPPRRAAGRPPPARVCGHSARSSSSRRSAVTGVRSSCEAWTASSRSCAAQLLQLARAGPDRVADLLHLGDPRVGDVDHRLAGAELPRAATASRWNGRGQTTRQHHAGDHREREQREHDEHQGQQRLGDPVLDQRRAERSSVTLPPSGRSRLTRGSPGPSPGRARRRSRVVPSAATYARCSASCSRSSSSAGVTGRPSATFSRTTTAARSADRSTLRCSCACTRSPTW